MGDTVVKRILSWGMLGVVLRAGDEVTLTYLSEDDMLRNTAHRRQLLEGAKDFKCMCER